jgi:hypothetical protein
MINSNNPLSATRGFQVLVRFSGQRCLPSHNAPDPSVCTGDSGRWPAPVGAAVADEPASEASHLPACEEGVFLAAPAVH